MAIDWRTVKKTPVLTWDCTTKPEGYFEIGQSVVKDGYRETAPVEHARFGVWFDLKHMDKPHLLEIHYPDDKPRILLCNNGSSYDMSCGVLTDGEGGDKVMYNLYWPRWERESLLICSWHGYEPAAAYSCVVYELDELPPEVSLPQGRRFGMQYEDPCNIGAGEGTFEFYGWLDRHVQYMKMTGQDRLVYPIHWYAGPQVPVTCQPTDKLNVVISRDRKHYSRCATSAWNWLEELLTRFDKEGMHFTASLTLLRLGNLLKHMNVDNEAIRAGADTYNNVRCDGKVVTSCNDWTGQYNAIICEDKVKAAMNGQGKLTTWAYGEKVTTSGCVPMFNVLHPEVQSQLLTYFSELAQMYGSHPSFEGLSINVWHASFIWYGNLEAGYDDVSFGLFEKETGLSAGFTGPDRFQKRYEWVTANHLETFIDWRCRRITQFIGRLRDALTAIRPDLTLTINMWNETSVNAHLWGILNTEAGQYGNRLSQYETYRRGGIDFRMLAKEPNVILSIERNAARDRSKGPEPEKRHMFTDMGWLDTETYEILEQAPLSHNYNMNCWCEAWGQHSIFDCDPEDPNVPFVRDMPDYTADYIFRENSYYPDDPDCRVFGTDQQIRITAPQPADYLEYLSAGLALHDALSITAGGLYMDKAHAPEQLAFAEEYRKLPPVKFHTVMLDPVAVRWHESGWVYALSREPYPIAITLLGDTVTLEPFQLKVWQTPIAEAPAVQLEIDAQQIAAYHRQAEETITLLKNSGIPTAGDIANQIDQALDAGEYARLRHLVGSYYPSRLKQ